ncbi:MAG: hypothetical protein M3082_11635 [Candidatus Dormibacteraeota bacterium]|nr:hypothetical protein [Candidatus Dormibacteraeota bacterium]
MAVAINDIVLITGNPLTGSRGTSTDLAVVRAVADGNNNVLVESVTNAIRVLVPFGSIIAKLTPVAP